MSDMQRIVMGAIGGGLIVYGLVQRARIWEDDTGAATGESWIGIVLGGLLLLGALLSSQ